MSYELLLCLEKIASGGERWSRRAEVALLAWGAAVLIIQAVTGVLA